MFLFNTDTQSYTLAGDLKEAQAMVDALPRYLKEHELYGKVGGGGWFGGGTMPSLTPGALAMRLRRLKVLEDSLSPEQRDQLHTLIARDADIFTDQRQRYEARLLYEAQSRLKAMHMFFEECRSSPRQCASIYRPEALRRTVVEEVRLVLQARSIASAELDTLVRSTDARLRSVGQPADFIWETVLKPAYDAKQFWWLYAMPPAQ